MDELDGLTPRIKSYVTMDVRLAWKQRENLELAIVGQNLPDNQHAELGNTPPAEVERSVYGMVTLKF